MNIQHSYKLSEMAKEHNTPLTGLFETYSNLQTRYLRRDLDNPMKRQTVGDFIKVEAYGCKALEVMDRYLRMKK